MNLFPSFSLGNFFYSQEHFIPEIKFSKLVTNISIYIPIILFPGINKYNLKQIHMYLVYNKDHIQH